MSSYVNIHFANKMLSSVHKFNYKIATQHMFYTQFITLINIFAWILFIVYTIIHIFISIVMLIIILSINSVTNPYLFNKEVEGSLYHITNLTTLLMLKHRGSNSYWKSVWYGFRS